MPGIPRLGVIVMHDLFRCGDELTPRVVHQDVQRAFRQDALQRIIYLIALAHVGDNGLE